MGVQEEKKIEYQEDNAKLHQESSITTDVDDVKKLIQPAPDDIVTGTIAAIPTTDKCSLVSCDKDTVFARVEQEKRLALIKAWEDNEKAKADNKALKKFSAIASWENCKKAVVEAKLRNKEDKLEKVKAQYAEKIKNKMAEIHKVAEEKRAMVSAERGEEMLRVEEEAYKYQTTGTKPRKFLGCFS